MSSELFVVIPRVVTCPGAAGVEADGMLAHDAAGSYGGHVEAVVGQHAFHAAADGQLGGIMKLYRDWTICGDLEWLKKLYPLARRSLDFCIRCSALGR